MKPGGEAGDRLSAALRIRRWSIAVGRLARRLLRINRTVYVSERVAEYRGYWKAAAAHLGAEFVDITPEVWEVRLGNRRTRIANDVTQADDAVTLALAGDKRYCTDLAEALDLPVARVGVYRLTDLPAAEALLLERGGAFAVKPATGTSSGLGVTTHVRTPRELERAALLASLFGSEFLLERMVPAETCRLLYVGGTFVHAVRRRGLRVVGTGRHSIRQLLRAQGVRGVARDLTTQLTLAAQQLSLDTVPDSGRSVVARCVPSEVRTFREVRTVYTESITALVGADLIEQLRRLVLALGSHFVGVDIVTNDPSSSLEASGGAFLEMNTTPGIHHHYHTADDHRQHPAATKVLQQLLGVADSTTVPSTAGGGGGTVTNRHSKQPRRPAGTKTTAEYLRKIGVAPLPPRTSPFDPGYDPATLESHLEQSAHLMSMLKISMACWQIANEAATRRKLAAAKRAGVATVVGGGPFEVAVAQGQLSAYLDLCASFGFTRIECGEGFTELRCGPREIVAQAETLGLDVQFELGKKHGGSFENDTIDRLISQGHDWLAAGARQLVIEGRESACNVGLFDAHGCFNPTFADRFAEAFGLEAVVFEAPTKLSQFALLNHFGPAVHICNVRLEELLRVEIYRRGLHSDAFRIDALRPSRPRRTTPAAVA